MSENKAKYKSITTPITCSAAQYLAEYMCVRMAKKDKKQLSERFWNTDAWKLTYKKQLLAANNLLKVYEFQAILNALELKSSQWICSLWAKNLTEIIVREQELIKQEAARLEKAYSKEKERENVPLSPEITAKPFSVKKNKLGDLD